MLVPAIITAFASFLPSFPVQGLHPVPPVSLIFSNSAPVAASQPAFQVPGSSSESGFGQYGVTVSYKVTGVYPGTYVTNRLRQCESDVLKAYLALPASQRGELSSLTFRWTKDQNRGLGGGSTISLKCNDLSSSELTSVFVHEMGHVVDTGLHEGHSSAGVSAFKDFKVSVFKDDPSVAFYSISWKDTSTKWKDSSSLDFVSGYAKTDPFEDFSESYNFYMLHGAQFKYAAKFNRRLAQKYAYLRDSIFGGVEFQNNTTKLDPKKRSYDTTLLPFSLERFLKNV